MQHSKKLATFTHFREEFREGNTQNIYFDRPHVPCCVTRAGAMEQLDYSLHCSRRGRTVVSGEKILNIYGHKLR